MKFKFNPNQKYQLDAIASVVDLFSGKEKAQESFGLLPVNDTNDFNDLLGSFSNNLGIDKFKINENLKKIQLRNHIYSDDDMKSKGSNFSIEMETGTGKTYVYLRTIFELNKQYGFSKFIIVVPSVAIREGVIKSIELTKDHFRSLYDNVPFSYFVYNSKKLNALRNFPQDSDLKIMITNTDSFNKAKNVINQEREDGKYIEFIQNTKPVIIMDEPQNMESAKTKEAISSLKPLFTLRYSATHKERYNLVYRLNPVQAFQQKLVKKISVISTVMENDTTRAYIKLNSVSNNNNRFRCSIKVYSVTTDGKPSIKNITCSNNDDLYIKSNENGIYKNGFIISEINASPTMEFIKFSNGVKIYLGEEHAVDHSPIIKKQIEETIKEHFEKEKQVKGLGVKVLSLFFLDEVNNYRVYNKNIPSLGKYAKYFEEAYSRISKDYEKILTIVPASKVHDGYFSKDRKGSLKNTKGNQNDDYDTYSLIMKDKEKLLDINNPLKFIFSHSALREGWDNPNVFQICTLNKTNSSIKKRQEIGRGMRLPVNQLGERIEDEHINNLVIIANESYEEFADKLQKEFEDEAGVKFGVLPNQAFVGLNYAENKITKIEDSVKIWEHLKQSNIIFEDGEVLNSFDQAISDNTFSVPSNFKSIQGEIVKIIEDHKKENYVRKHTRQKISLNKDVFNDPEFKKFWKKISQQTIYSVQYSTKDLINNASKSINAMEKIVPLKITTDKADLNTEEKGVGTNLVKSPTVEYTEISTSFPDILSYIQSRVQLTRKTIFEILKESKRLSDFAINPQTFMDQAIKEIRTELHKSVIEGIKYEKLDATSYEMSKLQIDEQSKEYIGNKIIPTKKSIYDYIYWESGVEKKFAEDLEEMQDIKYFIKLPNWFKIPTPVGSYNPDWAILKKNGKVVYMIRETKSTVDLNQLRLSEKDKIKCGVKHYESIDVDYSVCTSIKDAKL